MSRLATSGMFSCATIAVSGFKPEDRDLNDRYEANPDAWEGLTDGMDVAQFYDDILYPVSQPLGKTGEYPFTRLMEEMRDHYDGEDECIAHKFVVCALPDFQLMDGYWLDRLHKWGFEEWTTVDNFIGATNHIFYRKPEEE